MYENFSFSVTDQSGDARCGVLHTPHGDVHTPAFIFCGTKASVKGVTPKILHDNHTQIILSNTYHLYVYPGSEHVRRLGGLHKMMGWNKPMFTDSGGFQIFSLGHGSVSDEIKGKRFGRSTLASISEEGAAFKSYWDGSIKFLTPEKSIEIQCDLGADLIVSFDECTPFHVEKRYTYESMRRSHRWEKRSLDEFCKRDDGSQALYGIIQGGVYEEFRDESCDFVNEHDFFAHAIGGSLGKDKEQMYAVTAYTMSRLRKDRPVHLLGIGGLCDIVHGASCGIDTFDCVHPTRIARHGAALVRPEYRINTAREHISLCNAVYKNDESPLDGECACYVCRNFTRAYIHYLLKAGESLAFALLTEHNIHFMNMFMQSVREAIKTNTLHDMRVRWCE